MLANVLKSPGAIAASVAIVRTFVRMRQALTSSAALTRRMYASRPVALGRLLRARGHPYSIVVRRTLS